MGGPVGRTNAPLVEELFDASHRFEFFQAVRILEMLAAQSPAVDAKPSQVPVGHDGPADNESIRFGATPSLAFPPAEISQLQRDDPEEGAPASPAKMTVNFLGLTGPSGVLPRHYTSLVIERCHVRHKDLTLRDFFDLFNHRTLSFFYRAWEKYRFPAIYERYNRKPAAQRRTVDDPFTSMLFALVGHGTTGLRQRLATGDESLLYYSGIFSHRPRCAESLQEVISDFFELKARISQFCGQWLRLDPSDQSSFPTATLRVGRNLSLGANTVAGSKIWDVQAKFRVRLGAVGYEQFSRFMPNGDRFVPLCQLVRLYAGVEYDYDVQVVLMAAEVPPCHLAADAPIAPHLGWNTWIFSTKPQADAEEAVFSPSEF